MSLCEYKLSALFLLWIYLIGINLPGRNLPIFEKGGKFLPGNLKHGQVMERRLKKKSYNLTMTMTEIL